MKIGWKTQPYVLKGSGTQDNISSLSVEFGDDIKLEARILAYSRPNSPTKHPTIYIRVGSMEIYISDGQAKIVRSAFMIADEQLTFYSRWPQIEMPKQDQEK